MLKLRNYQFYIERFEIAIKERFLDQGGDLWEAMRYSLFSKGKRLRPLLTLITAEALDEKLDVMDVAIATELLHTASIIADDLPAMDNENMRRGKPTLHNKTNEATAILATYGMISEAYTKIEQNYQSLLKLQQEGLLSENLQLHKVFALAIESVARLSGFFGATGGQYCDLFEKPRNEKELFDVLYKKTVSLFEGAFLLGYLFGGGEIEKRGKVEEMARDFGLAFQMIDDLEDNEQDKKNGSKVNSVHFLGEEEIKRRAAHHLNKFHKKNSELGLGHPVIERMVQKMAKRA